MTLLNTSNDYPKAIIFHDVQVVGLGVVLTHDLSFVWSDLANHITPKEVDSRVVNSDYYINLSLWYGSLDLNNNKCYY